MNYLKPPKANILDCMIDLVSMEEALAVVGEIIEAGIPQQIITLNAEIVYNAQKDQGLQEIINTARLVTPDGIGIVWAARSLGYKVSSRVTGIDMVHSLCRLAASRGWKIYLFGAAPGVAERAGQKLTQEYEGLNVCGCRDGYFTDGDLEKIINNIKLDSPDILMVALGAPKQEIFIEKYKDKLGVPVCMGIGGSLDVISGNKLRAPRIFIKLNLEWFYRLLAEPSRFRRQLALPKFALKIIKYKYFVK